MGLEVFLGGRNMALFELDNGRLIPAQFGHEVPDGFTPDILDAIRAQVLEIVSRPLFPITWAPIRPEGTPHQDSHPRLTALDASGQVVSVEVVQRLDAEILIDALSRLADTAAMSWPDLARRYPGGAEGFKHEWVNFRDAMPTSPPNGPRLILVAASIDGEVRPALDVLSSSGVEVHEMSLRQMSNGRAFLEIDAVGQRLYGHRPSSLVEMGEALPALASGPAAGVAAPAPAPAAPAPAAPVATPAPAAPVATPAPAPAPVPAAVPVVPARAHQLGEHGQIPPAPLAPQHADRTPPVSQAATTQRPRPAGPGGFPSRRQVHQTAQPQTEPHAQTAASPAAPPARRSSTRRLDAEPIAGPLAHDAQGLAVLAQLSGATPLALHPGSRTPQGARLSAEGIVIVPSGNFQDPTQALVAEGIVGEDGWIAWSLGDEHGPTLAEAIAEVNRSRN